MGFRKQSTILKLVFDVDDPEFTDPETGEQLEVRVRSLSLKKYNDLWNPFAASYVDFDGMADEMERLKTGESEDPEKAHPLADKAMELLSKMRENDPVRKLYGTFADNLVSWNLEDEDGNPVPTTYEGICSLETRFAKKLLNAWRDAMTAVDNPLHSGSTSGGPSRKAAPLELSIPMETL